jgi:positive regulator of sigma E activity
VKKVKFIFKKITLSFDFSLVLVLAIILVLLIKKENVIIGGFHNYFLKYLFKKAYKQQHIKMTTLQNIFLHKVGLPQEYFAKFYKMSTLVTYKKKNI